MRSFSIDLAGRAKNFKLPKNQPLVPVFEAIVNSIHAIDERRQVEPDLKGRIEIALLRETQIAMEGTEELPAVHSIIISDNGIGFNEPNFESFLKSDSTYKAIIGGKGVGRLSWLVAFEGATVNSVYKDGNEFVSRSFVFTPSNAEIDDRLQERKDSKDNWTSITLKNCKQPYRKNLPKRGSTIAMHIIEHCLVYFMASNCPEILLIDVNGTSYNLNCIFNEKIQAEQNIQEITIQEKSFKLLHVKVTEAKINGNKLYLCAHNRLVETKDLDRYIVDLDDTIIGRDGFWYIGVLTGEYLDESVDMNRLSFNIPEMKRLDTEDTVTMEQIICESVSSIRCFLSEYLNPVSKAKMDRIRSYVTHTAPQFRHLLKYMPEQIEAIKPNLTEEKLDDELHKIKREFDRSVKRENDTIISDLNNGMITTNEYVRRFESQIERINSANSAALADYIAHRKVIIDLMEYAIKQKSDGKYQLESFLHNIIYPMRSTSNEVTYDSHNLWLIDEKLSYFSYISSDIPFDNSPKEDRTDILILDTVGDDEYPLNHPVAISDKENDGTDYDTVVLFELKRPMRNDYTESANPVQQLYDYIRKLKTNRMKDKDGRYIKIGDSTKFYLYAVCDVTSTLEKILEDRDFDQTPDRLGYYRYNNKMNAYIEVLSYNKIVNDAKRRNKILFDKLGL